MKRMTIYLAALTLLVPSGALAAEAAVSPGTMTENEKLSYAMGHDMGEYLAGLRVELDVDLLKQGIEAGFSGAAGLLSEAEMLAIKQRFAASMQQRQQAELAEQATANTEEGEAYLAANQEKEGVVVTESGLQYEVITPGDGPRPGPDSTVRVEYVGKLIDGREFDSSKKRGKPAVFPVGQVIPGWTEVLQLMPVGSSYRVVIPSRLAYGERGAPPVIGPNSVLEFDIDLLGIEEE